MKTEREGTEGGRRREYEGGEGRGLGEVRNQRRNRSSNFCEGVCTFVSRR